MPKGHYDRHRPRPTSEALHRLYVEQRMSAGEIAERYGVGRTTVRNWLIRADIDRRHYDEAMNIALAKGRAEVPQPIQLEDERLRHVALGISLPAWMEEQVRRLAGENVSQWVEEAVAERLAAIGIQIVRREEEGTE